MFMPFGFIAAKTLNDLTFQYVDYESHLMKVIPERVVRNTFDIFLVNKPHGG